MAEPGPGPSSGERSLTDALEDAVADRPSDEPGCGVGVARSGRHAQIAFGSADLEGDVPIDKATLFDIASGSKQFTGAAIVRLIAEGKLSVNDRISDRVPRMARYPDEVSVAQLLHHTSGIPDYVDALHDVGRRDDDVITQTETVDVIATLTPESEPGTEFLYSNSNYVLLAEVVEAVAARSFPEFLDNDLFGPAGMTTAFVHDYGTRKVPQLALSYDEDGVPQRSRWQQRGDGAIHATVGDMLRWGEYLFEAKAGAGPLLDAMADGAVEVDDEGDTYGAGLIISSDGARTTLSHDGSWLGFESYFLVVPDDEVVVAVLCNGTETGGEELLDTALDLAMNPDL